MKYKLIHSLLSSFVMSVISTLLLSSLLFSAMVYAEKETQTNSSSASEDRAKKINREKQQTQWPPTFVPSEKIDADSSVSFPVDI
ncbi:MAG: hypothetical protein OQL19_17975 [Gammaproteobacteria bacterium]|nr:hypothetical protein [Gammaproteobacteria bacterium]